MSKTKTWKQLSHFDVKGPLVSYGESTGPPYLWPIDMTKGGRADNQGSRQQCDDNEYLEQRSQEPEGLYNNVEGEAIGDFC